MPAERTRPRRSYVARAARAAALSLLVLAAAGWLLLPYALIPRFRRPLEATPADVGLAFETVRIEAGEPPVALVAWWMPVADARGTVLLLHDGGSNRSFLWSHGLGLARALHDRGYAVLAPDLRGHGESAAGGEGVLLGGNLAPDVSAWIDWVEGAGARRPVAAVGFGLGGQVAIYAGARDPRIAAVVADSTWADLRSSVETSIPSATGLPRALVRSGLWNAERLYGIDFGQSRAVDVVPALAGRLLLVTNEEDPQVPRRQLRWLERAAGRAEVWVSPAPPPDHPLYATAGPWGTHSRSSFLYPEEYARRVGAFLDSRLPLPPRPERVAASTQETP
jgi:pimeloyl-ACP methyl ester carboxylesterase